MPKGPQGQWRPAGAGALAVHVCRIATGEIEETYDPPQADLVTPSQADERALLGRPERRRSRQSGGLRSPPVVPRLAGLLSYLIGKYGAL